MQPKNVLSSALYIVALALEAGLLVCGFYLALNETIPPHYRLIGVMVLFTLAVMATLWAGRISLMKKDEIRQHPILLLGTLPVRLLMCALFAAVVVAILVLIGGG